MSSRRRRRTLPISSQIGLIRFYEEVEEKITIPPYVVLLLAYTTSIIVILLRLLVKI